MKPIVDSFKEMIDTGTLNFEMPVKEEMVTVFEEMLDLFDNFDNVTLENCFKKDK